jgi:hypothetical protein
MITFSAERGRDGPALFLFSSFAPKKPHPSERNDSMRRHLSVLVHLTALISALLFLAVLFMAIFCYPLDSRAAFEFAEIGARPAALAGAYCALSDDAHGPMYNPAGTGWASGRAIAMSACRPFGLVELDTQEFSILQPVSGWVAGLYARRFGGHLYREITMGLSCSHRFLDNLSIGWCLRGLQLAISGYGSDETWSLDTGILAVPGTRWRWGMAIRNLNNGRLGQNQEGMAQVLMVGLACRPEEFVWLSADLLGDAAEVSSSPFKPGAYPLEWRLGCEARPRDLLALRLGLQNHPLRISAGLEISAGPFRLGYAWRSHQLLSPTHHLTLIVR